MSFRLLKKVEAVSEMRGNGVAGSLRVAVVAGRFNEFIVEKLVDGVRQAVAFGGGSRDSVDVFWAPGAFEIPQVLKRVESLGSYGAIVCVGAVIRGGTPHFEYVAGAAANGVASIAAGSDTPITFGVLTCDTIEQAIERAGTKAGNKGFEAGMAALELSSLLKGLGK